MNQDQAKTQAMQDLLDSQGYLDIPPGRHDCDGLVINRDCVIRSQGGVLVGTKGVGIDNPKAFYLSVTGGLLEGYEVGIKIGGTGSDHVYESMIRDCRIYNCTQFGIYWDGPSDGFIVDTVVGGPTYPLASIFLGQGCGAVTVRGTHVWGGPRYGLVCLAPDAYLSGVQCEGAKVAEMALGGWRITVDGARLFDPVKDNKAIGLQMGIPKGDPVLLKGEDAYAAYCTVRGVQVGKQSEQFAGARLRLTPDREGSNLIELFCPATTTDVVSGSPHPEDQITVATPSVAKPLYSHASRAKRPPFG